MGHKFVQAHWYKVANRGPDDIDLIVIHAMQAAEKGSTAENVANYFKAGCPDANGKKRPASAHLCIDNNSIIQCVRYKDVAFGAPKVNHNGIHIEHAGFSEQTRSQWLDEYGQDMLRLSANEAAHLAKTYHIPAVWLTAPELRRRSRGFVTHAVCSEAFTPGGHWDPGDGFPFKYYMDLVKEQLGLLDKHAITIFVGADKLDLPASLAFVRSGASYGWVRPIADKLGLQIRPHEKDKTVVVSNGTKEILLAAEFVTVDNKTRAVVELAPLSRLGIIVAWDSQGNAVHLMRENNA